MRLLTLTIVNFKGFDGDAKKNSIDFKGDKNKPFVVFSGDNGMGKTTIWEAINWVFFGEFLIQDRTENKEGWSLLTDTTPAYIKAKKNRKREISVEVQVTIEINETEFSRVANFLPDQEFSKSNKINIKRTYTLKFPSDGTAEWKYDKGKYRDYLQMNQITPKGEKPISFQTQSKDKEFLYNFLPFGIRRYYFFDAANEDIRTLAVESSNVQRAVRELSGINRAYGLEAILEKIIAELSKKLSSGLGKKKEARVIRLSEEIKDLTQLRNNKHERLTELREEIIPELKKTIGSLQGKVGKGQAIKDLLQKKEDNNKDISHLQKENKILQGPLHQAFAEHFPSIQLHDECKDLYKAIDKEQSDGRWPQNIGVTDTNNVSRTIEKHKIIDEISTKLKIKKKSIEDIVSILIQRLVEVGRGARGAEGLDISTILRDLDTINDEAPMNFKDIETKLQEIEKNDSNIHTLQTANEDIFKELQISADVEGQTRLLNEIKELELAEKDFPNREQEADTLDREISDIRKNIQQKESERAQLLSGVDKDKLEKQRARVLKSIKKEVATQITPFEARNRENVQESLNGILERIFTMKLLPFEQITLNREYIMTAVDGTNVGSLSRGQKVMLALAFIFSLIESSGAMPPLVVDAPMAHISEEFEERLYECYKDFANQAIFFMMPGRELSTSKATDYVIKNSAKLYTISKKDKSSPIEIKRGITE